jgi:cold shock protein
MLQGKVRWFNEAKGFGFIDCDGVDYFIHYKEIKGEGFKLLKQGEQVIFEPSKSPKGFLAKSVVKQA